MQNNDRIVYHVLISSEYHHQIVRSPREAARVLDVTDNEIYRALRSKSKIRDVRLKYIRLDYTET